MSHALDAEVTGDAARAVIALFLECPDLTAVIAAPGADRTARSLKSQGQAFGGGGVVRSHGPGLAATGSRA